MQRQLLLVLETTDTSKDTSHIVLGCLIDETKLFFSRADYQLVKGVSALNSSSHASPEPFWAIAGRRSCQDRPFPWTSPGCTFTKTKSLRRPGGSSCFQPTQRPVLCKAACPGAAVPAQSTVCRQGVRRQACFIFLGKHSRHELAWKLCLLWLKWKSYSWKNHCRHLLI